VFRVAAVNGASNILSANEVALSFGHQHLLEGVTLAVAAGEKVGLVGRNGSGKTSLLKILAGEIAPDAGEITRRRGVRVGYLPQDFELDGTKTVRENIEAGAADLLGWLRRYESGQGSEAELGELLHLIEHADGWNLQARIKAEADALGVPPLNKLVGELSAARSGAWRCVVRWPRSRICCCSMNRQTISMRKRFAGWRIVCASFPERSSSSRTTVTSSM
jgi:ATPase subunit of ABC transporter with duplicated ATPase domains